jgi:hypothetical protein
MDQIGTSHITTADLLICSGAVLLILYLKKLPRHSTWSRVLALLCGGAIFAIFALIVLVDLHSGAVLELAFIALTLCWSLWEWNDRSVKPNVASDVSPSKLTD